MKQAIEAAFPAIEFVFTLHCSPATFYELRQSLQSETAEDIVLSPSMQAISDIAPYTLLDLSAQSFTNAYAGLDLEACQIDGKLYYLPGPSNTFGIVYDKTLFAANGWSSPQGYFEFIALYLKIEATGIRAIPCQGRRSHLS